MLSSQPSTASAVPSNVSLSEENSLSGRFANGHHSISIGNMKHHPLQSTQLDVLMSSSSPSNLINLQQSAHTSHNLQSDSNRSHLAPSNNQDANNNNSTGDNVDFVVDKDAQSKLRTQNGTSSMSIPPPPPPSYLVYGELVILG